MAFQKGYIPTLEHRKNLSIANKISHKGKKLSEEHKKNISKGGMGRVVSEETRKKISKSNMGIEPWNKNKTYKEDNRILIGEKSGGWKGGISFKRYPKEFKDIRDSIRLRDDYTCQECNYDEYNLGYELAIHHIDYNKKNNQKDNLIGLCKICHAQTNWKRDDWTYYFNNKGEFNQ